MLRPRCLSGSLTAAVAILAAAACSFSGNDDAAPARPASTTPSTVVPVLGRPPPVGAAGCRPVPPPSSQPPPAWLPADLPLPPRSFFIEEVTGPSAANTSQALFAVPGDMDAWIRFTNAEWHKTGWIQGRGEAEPGERENTYVRAREGGAWRIRTAFCDKAFSELLLVYKK